MSKSASLRDATAGRIAGAFFVSGLIAIGMRAITSTPVGKP